MKKVVKIEEIEEMGRGLESLMGKRATLFCANYIYRGVLVEVAETFVLLDEAQIVYETGSYDDPKWKDAQKLGQGWFVERGAIESYGLTKSDLIVE